jgi:hypothetical protein
MMMKQWRFKSGRKQLGLSVLMLTPDENFSEDARITFPACLQYFVDC